MSMNEAIERIQALNDAWTNASDARDLDGMMAVYAEDARELLPDMAPLVGREEIRAFYAGLIERFPRFRHRFQPDAVVVAASEDLAVFRGTYAFTPDTREPAVMRGKYVGVWRRHEEDWRLIINISNGDGEPAS